MNPYRRIEILGRCLKELKIKFMRCTRCNSNSVHLQNGQSVWIGYMIAIAFVGYGLKEGDVTSILLTFFIGAAIVFFYKKWVNKKYYCNDCEKSWTEGGFD
jgi:hypothetical protein